MNPAEIQELLKTSRTLRLSLNVKMALPLLLKAIKSGVKSTPVIIEFIKVCTLLEQKNQLLLLVKNLGIPFFQKHIPIGYLTRIRIVIDQPQLISSLFVPFDGWTSSYKHTSKEEVVNSIIRDMNITTDHQGCGYFELYLECQHCGKQHAKLLKRTLVFSSKYLCPNCCGKLHLWSRQLVTYSQQILPELQTPSMKKYEQITTKLYKELNHPDLVSQHYSVYAHRGYFDYIYFISQAIADRVSHYKITTEKSDGKA